MLITFLCNTGNIVFNILTKIIKIHKNRQEILNIELKKKNLKIQLAYQIKKYIFLPISFYIFFMYTNYTINCPVQLFIIFIWKSSSISVLHAPKTQETLVQGYKKFQSLFPYHHHAPSAPISIIPQVPTFLPTQSFSFLRYQTKHFRNKIFPHQSRHI